MLPNESTTTDDTVLELYKIARQAEGIIYVKGISTNPEEILEQIGNHDKSEEIVNIIKTSNDVISELMNFDIRQDFIRAFRVTHFSNDTRG